MTTLTVPVSSPLTIATEIAAIASGSTTLRLVGPFDAREVTVASGWVTAAQQASAVRTSDRNGTPRGGASVVRLDYGTAATQTLLTASVYQSFATSGFDGFGVGSLVGGQLDVAYDPPGGAARGHVPHGGAHATDGIRAMLAALPAGARVADTAQEHVAHLLDLAQESDGPYPGHLLQAEETLLALGVLDQPAQSRDMSPALWSTVYSERSQTGRLMAPLTGAGRDDSLYHPHNETWNGLTGTQWQQLAAWSAATLAVHGHVPLFKTTARRFADRVTTGGIATFLALLQDALTDTAWCAQFVAYGRSELPLRLGREVTPECDREFGAGPDSSTNPVHYVRQISPEVSADCIPPLVGVFRPGPEFNNECSRECSRSPATGTTGWGAAHQAFPVHAVLHAVWRDRAIATDAICLVVVNWTASAAAWCGWFAPWFYSGFASGRCNREFSAECARLKKWHVHRLNQDGTATLVAQDLADAILLTTSGTSGSLAGQALSLAPVPAYSLQAYRITHT